MFLTNNPNIDTQALEKKVRQTAAERRREQVLVDVPFVAAPALASNAGDLVLQRGWKARVKRVPVLGKLAVKLNRFQLNMRMPGLTWQQKVKLLPLLGPLAVWSYGLFKLTSIRVQLNQELTTLRQQQMIAQRELRELQAKISALSDAHVEARVQRLEALNAGERLAAFDAQNLAARVDDVQAHFGRMQQDFANHVHQSRAASEELDHRVAGMVLNMHKLMRAPAATAAAEGARPALPPARANMDGFYVEFEARFRGSPAFIKGLQQVYLPYLDEFRSNAKGLDIGCGRGEWLELMKENGFACSGVDLNAAMVEQCRARGFDVHYGDAVAYLRSLPAGSLAFITGFQIIEHIPFETLADLFDAALHALRPHGLVIFETPNPENLQVGARSFYYDPTHIRPIAPEVAAFLARQRGFAAAEILRLNPIVDERRLPGTDALSQRLNDLFCGPQDYAVIARTPNAN